MKIAAMAAGAVGAYFGGRMQAAGHDVAYIARRAHLDALRKDGLKIESVHGDLHLPKVNATPDPKEVGPVDVVLFAVKLWDTETAAELAKPLVGPNTRVITLQNGVDSYERVSAILGKDATCPGTAYIAAVLGGPGVMRHTSKFATMRVGRMDGKPDAKLAAFVEAAKAANIDIQPQDDMNRERWQKFIFLSSMAGVNCMMREPIGKVLADPDTRAFYKKLMQECLAVGQKSGAKVPNSWVDDRMTFSDNAPPGMKASMLHDLEAGNRLELDWLTGKIVALGKELGVPTPGSDAVYAAVKLHRMGTAGLAAKARVLGLTGRCARRKERIWRTASGIRSFGSFHGNMLTSDLGASIAASMATAYGCDGISSGRMSTGVWQLRTKSRVTVKTKSGSVRYILVRN